jgi:formiminoglutamase
MDDSYLEQLKKRKKTQLDSKRTNKIQDAAFSILQASTDLGVCRNGGRRGSSFAPQAILAHTIKMPDLPSEKFIIADISDKNLENENFESAQAVQQANFAKYSHKPIIHLGGGHDHILPLLNHLSSKNDNITIINIDAHLDTRLDPIPHSGTPFRQFSNSTKIKNLKLLQFGIHQFANSKENYEKLANGEMKIWSFDDLESQTNHFHTSIDSILNYEVAKNSHLIISLDCDALDSSLMSAVSAVNHRGLPLHFVSDILNWSYKNFEKENLTFGVYEYNPLYDDLSCKGAKALASLLYQHINFLNT